MAANRYERGELFRQFHLQNRQNTDRNRKRNINFELSNRVALEKPILLSEHQEPIGATY